MRINVVDEPWLALHRELEEWRKLNWTARFWWRDDDAIGATPALERLIGISDRYYVSVGLAVIPMKARKDLASKVMNHPTLWVLQHGIAHIDHRRPDDPKSIELGGARDLDAIEADLTKASARLRRLFGPKALPVLVPPWNSIDSALLDRLHNIGFRGLSTAGRRKSPANGIVEANGHINPIAHEEVVQFSGSQQPMAQALQNLQLRRRGEIASDEPIGLLTHHLQSNEEVWLFVESFLAFTKAHPAVQWIEPTIAFATP